MGEVLAMMSTPPADLVAALQGLVNKLDLVAADPQFQSMAVMALIHGQTYGGPNWAKELAAAKALLAGVPEPPKDGICNSCGALYSRTFGNCVNTVMRDGHLDVCAGTVGAVPEPPKDLPPWTRCDFYGAAVLPTGPYVLLSDLQATRAVPEVAAPGAPVPEGLCTACSATQYCREHEPLPARVPLPGARASYDPNRLDEEWWTRRRVVSPEPFANFYLLAPEDRSRIEALPSPPDGWQAQTRYAWLLERSVDDKPAYWDGGHAESFTRDAQHAIQFSRQLDAYRSQRALLVPPRWGWKIVEHGFMSTLLSPPPPQPPRDGD